MNAFEIREMNRRIKLRWAATEDQPRLPVRGPGWAGAVVDTGGELVALHAITGAPYPLSLHQDLAPEEQAIVVVRRILLAGGTIAEAGRFVDSFDLADAVRDRLKRQLADGAPR